MKEEIISFPNGRIYKIVETGKEYKKTQGQYNASFHFEGGFVIYTQLKSGEWVYIDNSPDQECLD